MRRRRGMAAAATPCCRRLEETPPVIDIEINDRQSLVPLDHERLRTAVRGVLAGEAVRRGAVSVAVVDDATIRDLNRRYLGHDWATDVISFPLERDGDSLEGEIIVSAETALRLAASFGWRPEDELLLYLVHGALHLAGYDDQAEAERAQMRARERHYLSPFALQPRYDET